MHLFVQACILGLLTGGVYALMACGLTLAFGIMRVINVAQGALIILGAYLSYWLFTRFRIDPFVGDAGDRRRRCSCSVSRCSSPSCARCGERARGAVAARHVGDRARDRGRPQLRLSDHVPLDEHRATPTGSGTSAATCSRRCACTRSLLSLGMLGAAVPAPRARTRFGVRCGRPCRTPSRPACSASTPARVSALGIRPQRRDRVGGRGRVRDRVHVQSGLATTT